MKNESNIFSSLLFLTFLILKLCHVIDWSWWWITCPLWGTVILFIIGMMIYIIWMAIKPEAPPEPKGKSRWEKRYDDMMANKGKTDNNFVNIPTPKKK